MSSGAGVVLLLPVALAGLAIGGVAYGAARGTILAADGIAAHQQRRYEARCHLERAEIDFSALAQRVDDARQRYGKAAISPLPDPLTQIRTGDNSADTPVALMRQAIVAGEAQLREELAAAGVGVLVSALSAEIDALKAAYVQKPVRPRPGRSRASLEKPLPPPTTQDVERILRRLESAVSAKERDDLLHRAALLLTAPSGQIPALLRNLAIGVTRANATLAERRSRLEQLHTRLDLLGGAAVDDARCRLYESTDDPYPDWPGLTAAVESAIRQAIAEAMQTDAVQEFTAAALRESLQEIGCEVEADFDVLLVQEGVAHLRHRDWESVAVRVRRSADAESNETLHFNLIADAGAGDLADGTEQQWCTALDQLLVVLGHNGLVAEVTDRTQIGHGQIQRVASERFPFAITADDPAAADEQARVESAALRRRTPGPASQQRELRGPR
jgi:hypothetical protein